MSVSAVAAAPFFKNVVLITSVLYTLNNGHPMSRSVFSHEERFEQTKLTISRAREKIPQCAIFFVECSDLSAEHRSYILGAVDFFFNLYDIPELRCRMFTKSKAMGEGTQTIYVMDYIFKNGIRFDNFFKISGRYYLDNRFNYEHWDNPLIVVKEFDERKNVFTFLYKMSYKHAQEWFEFLKNNEANFQRAVGYELIYGHFVGARLSDTMIIPTMGIEGFISPDGSHVYV